MKPQIFRLTTRKAEEVLAFLRTTPAHPVGDHLSDDDFVGYVTDGLPAEEGERVDTHLASCVECATEMERLLEASEVWRGEEEQEDRFEALRRHISGAATLWERLTASLRDFVLSRNVAFAGARAATPRIEDGQTEDGSLRWRIVEDEEGNLTVRFGSHVLAWEGLRLRLRVGDWYRDLALAKAAPDQVGAETVISRAERVQFPVDAVLGVEFPSEEAGAGPTR